MCICALFLEVRSSRSDTQKHSGNANLRAEMMESFFSCPWVILDSPLIRSIKQKDVVLILHLPGGCSLIREVLDFATWNFFLRFKNKEWIVDDETGQKPGLGRHRNSNCTRKPLLIPRLYNKVCGRCRLSPFYRWNFISFLFYCETSRDIHSLFCAHNGRFLAYLLLWWVLGDATQKLVDKND